MIMIIIWQILLFQLIIQNQPLTHTIGITVTYINFFQSITPMPTNRLQQYEEIDMNNTLTILNDHNNNVR